MYRKATVLILKGSGIGLSFLLYSINSAFHWQYKLKNGPQTLNIFLLDLYHYTKHYCRGPKNLFSHEACLEGDTKKIIFKYFFTTLLQ